MVQRSATGRAVDPADLARPPSRTAPAGTRLERWPDSEQRLGGTATKRLGPASGRQTRHHPASPAEHPGDLRRGWVTIRIHWRTVLSISIAVAVVIQLCSILIQHFFLPAPTEIDRTASSSEQLRQSLESLRTSMVELGPVSAISLIGTIFTTAVLTIVVSRSVLGRPVTLPEAWGEAKPQLARLVGLSLLLPLVYAAVVTIGILPGLLTGGTAGAGLTALGGLAALVVMIWLWVRLSLAGPALMLERQGIPAAIRRSAKLVRGVWWRIFGIMLLTVLLTLIVSMIISVPFNTIAFAADGKSLSDLFSGNPPEFGWTYLIISGVGAVITTGSPTRSGRSHCASLRGPAHPSEALDIDSPRSAGVPGYPQLQGLRRWAPGAPQQHTC